MNMKQYIIIGCLILFLLIVGIVLFINFSPKNVNENSVPVNFPQSSNSGKPNTTGANSGISIPLRDGTQVVANDFIHNGTTIEDPANRGTYYLAGSSGACDSSGNCPKAGTVTDFTVVYYPNEQSFGIGLGSEPLGKVRQDAEKYLMQALNLTKTQMCALNYDVMTTTYVNQQYGGKNLGFSFCPGAIQLP